jgi:multidrug efflux system outer membrane protein
MQPMNNKFSIIIIVLFSVSLQSCFIGKKYTRTEMQLAQPDMFRAELNRKDSSTIADIGWKDFFKDTLLIRYIELALEENLDLKIAVERIKTSQAYYQQARSQFFPSVTLAPEVSYNTQSLNTQFGQLFGERRHLVQYNFPFSLSWEADIWGKINSAKRASQATLLSTIASSQAQQSLLISNVAKLYYQLLILDEQYNITESTITARTKSLETSKALKEAGTLTEVAVKQNEALLLNAKGLLINLNNQRTIAENALSLILNQSPQKIERTRLDQQSFNNELLYGVPYDLLNNRPDVRAAEYELINAFELTNVAEASFYPSLRITANTGLQSIDIDRLFRLKSLFVNTIASLTQPIWNKRQLRTQKEIALANQQIAYLQYRKSIINATNDVSNALALYQSQTELMSLKQQEYNAYLLATEYSQELVNYGLANYLEVIRAQENELIAQMSYLNANFAQLNAVVDLYRALGGGAN